MHLGLSGKQEAQDESQAVKRSMLKLMASGLNDKMHHALFKTELMKIKSEFGVRSMFFFINC